MAEEKPRIGIGTLGMLGTAAAAMSVFGTAGVIPIILIILGAITFASPFGIVLILLGVTILILGGGVITWLFMHGTVIAIIVGIILGLKLIKAF